ncbi:hypothetical protein Ahy_A01g000097 [Arachis hypogaea]|uniref:Aminotransferase-like plant mobile domain-containing protein n=1 Tax=Arachis hypogaea TaxID=3818 RepID=A0A445EJB8_ARAHY|nr:hypothetical protein Ahy_A01g000097 [Arachis hypogaea]
MSLIYLAYPLMDRLSAAGQIVVSQSIVIFCEPVVSSSSISYIKLAWVCRIRDAESLDTLESIQRYVRCLIFYLLGSTLFPDKSMVYAHAKYLPLLRDFDRIHTYNWVCMPHASL